MTIKLLITVFASIFIVNICAAQSSSSQTVTNWGASVEGVQLSISLTNNVLARDSSTTVQFKVRNTSTNLIYWNVVNPTQGFDVFLTNNVGDVYFLTPEQDTNSDIINIYYAMAFKVKSGELRGGSVPIVIEKKIKPGKYQLEARQYIYILGKRQSHELVSNILEVQVD